MVMTMFNDFWDQHGFDFLSQVEKDSSNWLTYFTQKLAQKLEQIQDERSRGILRGENGLVSGWARSKMNPWEIVRLFLEQRLDISIIRDKVKFWDSCDADMQTVLFGLMITSAKDPDALEEVWRNTYDTIKGTTKVTNDISPDADIPQPVSQRLRLH